MRPFDQLLRNLRILRSSTPWREFVFFPGRTTDKKKRTDDGSQPTFANLKSLRIRTKMAGARLYTSFFGGATQQKKRFCKVNLFFMSQNVFFLCGGGGVFIPKKKGSTKNTKNTPRVEVIAPPPGRSGPPSDHALFSGVRGAHQPRPTLVKYGARRLLGGWIIPGWDVSKWFITMVSI